MLFYKCQGEKKKNRDKNSLQTTFKRNIIDRNKTQDGGGDLLKTELSGKLTKRNVFYVYGTGGTRTQNKLIDTDIRSATSSHIFF